MRNAVSRSGGAGHAENPFPGTTRMAFARNAMRSSRMSTTTGDEPARALRFVEAEKGESGTSDPSKSRFFIAI